MAPHTAILFQDETDLLLFPPLRKAWMPKGTTRRIPLSGWNEKRVVFGALNVRTGKIVTLSRHRNRGEDFRFFLRHLRATYRRWPVCLVLDRHPSHWNPESRKLARELRIRLLWLPKRAPEMNPMDTLWGQIKDPVCANHQFEEIEDEVDAFLETLHELPPKYLLQLSGLDSPDYWLW
jgi:transposase